MASTRSRYTLRRPSRRALSQGEEKPDTRLPLEIISHIMSFLWDDIDSLNSASLVNHFWRSASLRHVYRSIPLTSGSALKKLESLLADPKLPALKTWVEEIRFPAGTLDDERNQEWARNIHDALAHKLPNVYTIKFDERSPCREFLTPTRKGYQLHEKIVSTFSQAKEVQIVGAMRMQAIYATIKALPLLAHLRIQYPPNTWAGGGSRIPLPSKDFSRSLESLWLEGCDAQTDDLLRWAASTPSKSTLREFTMSVSKAWSCAALAKFLPKAGMSLEKLELRVDDEKFIWEEPEMIDGLVDYSLGIDLSSCTALRRFTLPDPQSPISLKLINQLPLSASNLQSLLFDISFDSYDFVKGKDCQPMDERLSQSDMKNIREIGFRYEGKLRLDAAKSTIMNLFPLITAQGKIEVYE